MIFAALILGLTLSPPAPAAEGVSEFCNIALPAIQAPFSCASERKSAETLEGVLAAYRTACPSLQDRFEGLDQERQKLVHRCVLFNPNKKAEPAGCAAERAATADKLRAYGAEVSTMLDRVISILAGITAEAPRGASCKAFHEQHKILLGTLKDRLHNLRLAAERAERESRAEAPSPKDHERVFPSLRQ